MSLKLLMHTWRGHKIEETAYSSWIYADTKEPVEKNPSRDCGHCGLANTPEGYDGCTGYIEGAINACCGHGKEGDRYVQYDN